MKSKVLLVGLVLTFIGVGCDTRKGCDGEECIKGPDHFHNHLEVIDAALFAENRVQQGQINRLEKFYINSVIGSPEEFCGECRPKWDGCRIQESGGVTCDCVCGEVEEAPIVYGNGQVYYFSDSVVDCR